MKTRQIIVAIAALVIVSEAVEEREVIVHTRTRVVTEWTTVTCTATTTSATQTTKPWDNHDTKLPQQSGYAPSGSAPSSVSKRGILYNKAELTAPFVGSNKITWAWNWDSSANGLDPGVEFVPTLWGPIDVHTQRWSENANAAIATNSAHLLSFNECDRFDQCNTSAVAAADAHVQYMNPFGDRVKIGAPSVSNSNVDGEGLDWLRDWVRLCKDRGCKYDFCTIHWYSPLREADALYTHIKEAYGACGGKPIWLTEFAPIDDRGTQAAPEEASVWLEKVLPVLDNLSELERYSYFMVSEGKLVKDSDLTVSGQTYLT